MGDHVGRLDEEAAEEGDLAGDRDGRGGAGGYSRHILVCVGKSCCDGDDHKETLKRLSKRLKELEAEHAELKKMYAELCIENRAMKNLIEKKL